MGAASESASYAGAAIMVGANVSAVPAQVPPALYVAGVCVLAGLACGCAFAFLTWAGDRVVGFPIRPSATRWRWAAGIGIVVDCLFGFFFDGMLMHSRWGLGLPEHIALAFEIVAGFSPGIVTALLVLLRTRSARAT
jgi:hypothetical protein